MTTSIKFQYLNRSSGFRSLPSATAGPVEGPHFRRVASGSVGVREEGAQCTDGARRRSWGVNDGCRRAGDGERCAGSHNLGEGRRGGDKDECVKFDLSCDKIQRVCDVFETAETALKCKVSIC